DEPTIEAMNLMGLDYNGVGNHEFDRGLAHLRRLQSGARFRMLAANVLEGGNTVFPPYGIKDFGGTKVAFVGMTLRATPAILSPRARAGLEFRDEVETVAALVPELERQGVSAIVVLIHQGGIAGADANGCDNPWGPIFELAPKFHPMVRVVVSAHTHQAYVCRVGDRLVTSAGSYGRYVTEIALSADGSSRATNHPVRADLPADRAQSELLAHYGKLYEPFERVVGRLSAPLPREANADGESPLGRVMADAQLEATRGAGAVVAFMNRGGIRAPLQPAADGTITYADLYAAHPFGNTLVTMPLTGAQIIRMLELQWTDETRIMPVSRGFSYAWDPARPTGSRVVPGSVTIGGKVLEPDAVYRVTLNDYVANGGDGLAMLRAVRERTQGGRLLEALGQYLERNQPLAPPQDRRVQRID
ncbi:MAG TPA: bifunctional UDP-sugar hydrolase/5'-nucleotidase, partial [Burkholderiales bacterium]|nr:bifunctional UDP-sugar hydrolase/5'-nucleotidase [Burkholderiales bacterium]